MKQIADLSRKVTESPTTEALYIAAIASRGDLELRGWILTDGVVPSCEVAGRRAATTTEAPDKSIGRIGPSVSTVDEPLDANDHSFAHPLQSAIEGQTSRFRIAGLHRRGDRRRASYPSPMPRLFSISYFYYIRLSSSSSVLLT
jgi:hypothetical protein